MGMMQRKCRTLRKVIALTLVVMITAPAAAQTGTIRATIDTDEPIARVWAVQRSARTIETRDGEAKDIGVYTDRHAGRIDGTTIVIENLPVPGRYDLRLETESGGVLQGWDATVPESDYVGDPPIEVEGLRAVLTKQADEQFTAFFDEVRVLDVRGNLQNAAVLIAKLRRKPFAGGGYKPGEWVWRVDRWQWENPNEQTWVPYQERPFYALVRERLLAQDYAAKRLVYARHLGGVVLTGERAEVDLGALRLPRPGQGVFAVNPDGSVISPIVLKGPEASADLADAASDFHSTEIDTPAERDEAE